MPVNITEEFVRQLLAQIEFLTAQNNALIATVDSMNQNIDELNQTIRELKEQLNKNSQNSSRPSSSDGLKKPAVKRTEASANPLERSREPRKSWKYANVLCMGALQRGHFPKT